MDYNKFSFELRTQKTYCFAQVNGVNISNSNVTLGTMSSGYDLSTILQNGKNTMTIIFTGIDDDNRKKIEQDAYCTLLIKENKKGEIVNYASLVGNASDGLASGKNSPHYDGLGQAGKVTEGYWEKIDQMYKVERTFTVSGVQEWEWTKGSKIVDSDKNRELLYKQYIQLYKKLRSQDEKKLMEFFLVGLTDSAKNDNATVDDEWQSLGISKMLEDGYTPELEDINDFKLATYADGKLFKLENDYGHSPLRMVKKDEKTRALNPYFAYVDGKIIVAL
ncbi:hypothetical protein IHC87_21145 (plasmid) [Photobacterium damselae subsp. damselae]|uniref:hypothetical protein n=1 Tax=Photobacterium damselae TaxID=38293 RepID=UPI001F36CE17|nr:hypothetical protein [Photobacterium damselae]UJZ96583.1 hypothetical protein IHC87_21145 [Photobacterium damselae subsp. damselae]UKA00541.1 hypothetical protein IHC88_21070 [Photobacterium damselae subsp. damselae]